jgi:hypothetical protein
MKKDKKIKKQMALIKETYGDNEFEIEVDKISKYFHPSFAITVHRSQGMSYDFDYCIWEWDSLCDRAKYVALSRTKDKNFWHIYKDDGSDRFK